MVQTPVQLGTNPVQDRDVVPHEVQNFGGIAAVWSGAFCINHAPQLVGGLPPQTVANTTTFQSKDDAAQEGDALAPWDVIADPACCLCFALNEVCKGGSAFA
jgi:hypothetical protein